ncbi:MAG: GspH/FimT family pseudopilin [Pseudomonadota bacterium]
MKPLRCFAAERGLSLIEFLVTLSVLGLLLGAGIPAYGELVAAQEVRSAHSRLFAHLSLARTTAITEGKQTVLCPSQDGQRCSGSTEWQTGWLTFVDRNRNRLRDPDERGLAFGRLPEHISVVSSRARRAIRFLPSGASPGSNLTFTICQVHGGQPRAIILSNVGRARSSRTRPDGSPLICA